MRTCSPGPGPTSWSAVARAGRTAWFVANLYEGAVGMPQLLVAARAHRRPGLFAAGSPVRWFAPLGPVVVVASGVELAQQWRAGADRSLVGGAATGLAAALGISVHLIRSVNVPLLTGGPLDDPGRAVAVWHRGNVLRLVALGAAAVLGAAAERRGSGDQPGGSGGFPGRSPSSSSAT